MSTPIWRPSSRAGDAGPFDEAWCLGDLVGYGPDPNECGPDPESKHQAVAGNHDYAAVGVSLRDFNEGARRATGGPRPGSRRRTAGSGVAALQEQIGDFCLVHGSVRFPVWEYIDTPQPL